VATAEPDARPAARPARPAGSAATTAAEPAGVGASTAPAGPEDWTTFEQALKAAQSLGAMVEQIGKARGRCDCDDEFEERDCGEEKAGAVTWLEQQKFVIDKIEPERVVLGRYDFKKKVFPVSVTADVHTAKVRQCRLRTNRCTAISPKPTVIITAGKKYSWTGEISIPDEEWARALRTGEQKLRGEAILKVGAIKESTVRDPGAEAAKDEARVTLRALEAMPASERGEEYPKVKECVKRGETRGRQISVQAAVEHIRLELGETGFYIVSTLPSAAPAPPQPARVRTGLRPNPIKPITPPKPGPGAAAPSTPDGGPANAADRPPPTSAATAGRLPGMRPGGFRGRWGAGNFRPGQAAPGSRLLPGLARRAGDGVAAPAPPTPPAPR
jgi:hypothetical protein